MYRSSKLGALLAIILGWTTVTWAQDGGEAQDTKPERCEGVSTIEAVISDIKDLKLGSARIILGIAKSGS